MKVNDQRAVKDLHPGNPYDRLEKELEKVRWQLASVIDERDNLRIQCSLLTSEMNHFKTLFQKMLKINVKSAPAEESVDVAWEMFTP